MTIAKDKLFQVDLDAGCERTYDDDGLLYSWFAVG